MQIKNFTNGSIPFLLNYSPFVLPQNKQICRTVNDMIEYDNNLITETFVYNVGTTDAFIFNFNIKNVTDNAVLVMKSNYKENIFFRVDETTLNPGETKNITVTSNSEYLNTITTVEDVVFTLSFAVNNIVNGKLITKTVS